MFLLSCILFLALGLPASTSDSGDPVDIKKLEEVEVDLVLIDALVLDRKGRTVPGLTRDDFEVVVDMVIRPIDTLDELCDAGAADDPRGMRNPAKRAPVEAPHAGRKIVLAFDYLHLDNVEQVDVRIPVNLNAQSGQNEHPSERSDVPFPILPTPSSQSSWIPRSEIPS